MAVALEVKAPYLHLEDVLLVLDLILEEAFVFQPHTMEYMVSEEPMAESQPLEPLLAYLGNSTLNQ